MFSVSKCYCVASINIFRSLLFWGLTCKRYSGAQGREHRNVVCGPHSLLLVGTWREMEPWCSELTGSLANVSWVPTVCSALSPEP